ncbi:MAG: hypothetical protein IH921_09220 [Gemmatimonadetes bacterium]|nr:hypothetical protein [Gemmatimonadota bacterium]
MKRFIIGRPTVSLENARIPIEDIFAAERRSCFLARLGKSAFDTADTTVPTTLRIETEHKKSLGDQGSKTPQESRSLAKAPSACEFGEGTDKILRLVIGRQLIREMLGLTAPE